MSGVITSAAVWFSCRSGTVSAMRHQDTHPDLPSMRLSVERGYQYGQQHCTKHAVDIDNSTVVA